MLVTILVTALAVALGRGRGALAVALAVGAGQASVGWANDWLDRDRDRAAGRRDKPLVAGRLADATVARAALIAGGIALAASFLSGWRAGLVHVVALAGGWAYDLGLKATLLSPLPYLVSFGLLPAFAARGLQGAPWPAWWIMVGAACLGGAAHFANALPDLDDDAATGVRGLPHRVGAGASVVAAGTLVATGAGVLVLAPPGPVGPFSIIGLAVVVVLLAATAVAASIRPRAAFPLTMAAAAVAIAVVLAAGVPLLETSG